MRTGIELGPLRWKVRAPLNVNDVDDSLLYRLTVFSLLLIRLPCDLADDLKL